MTEPSLNIENSIPLLKGLEEIHHLYDAFILDIFGVVHDGIKPFPDTLNCLSKLQESGKKICLLSNSPRRAKGAVENMEEMGIPRDLYHHIVTSGESTFNAIKKKQQPFYKDLGYNCWFIGNDYVSDLTEDLDCTFLEGPEDADFILNAIPGTHDSEVKKLKAQLEIAAERDIPMICANPDLVVNIGSKQHECAGTFAAYYEELGGRVEYHGKPYAPVYQAALKELGNPEPSKILAIGDSLRTDIAGGNRQDIDTVFNLTGIHWDEIMSENETESPNIENIIDMIDRQPHKPTYILNGFQW